MTVNLTVNGQTHTIAIEPRMTLLDALREELALTGTKKACDRGECGACTVHIDGRRVLSCMTLAAMQEGKWITTIEGIEWDGNLHALQVAFIEHDGLQCGFCTSG
jgi:xanthine dehydrogenase YagT iron-sulfur-binding subunit